MDGNPSAETDGLGRSKLVNLLEGLGHGEELLSASRPVTALFARAGSVNGRSYFSPKGMFTPIGQDRSGVSCAPQEQSTK